MDGVTVRLAGTFAVTCGGLPDHVAVGSRKARLLLALLAVSRGRVVPTDRIVDVLWTGQRPRRPEREVATLVSRLRATLGAGVVLGTSAGYRRPAIRPHRPGRGRAAARRVPSPVGPRSGCGRRGGRSARLRPARRWPGPGRRSRGRLGRRPAGRARRAAPRRSPRHGRGPALRRRHGGGAGRSSCGPARRAGAPPAHCRPPGRWRAGPGAGRVRAAAHGAGRGAEGRSGARNPCRAPGAAHRGSSDQNDRGTVSDHARDGARRSGPGGPRCRGGSAHRGLGRGHRRSAHAAPDCRRGWHRQDPAGGGARADRRGHRWTGARRPLLLRRALAVPPAARRRAGLALAALPAARLRTLVGPRASAFAGLWPDLVDELGTPVEYGIPEIAVRRAFEAVTAVLRGLATDRPTLLLLDDLHQAGQGDLAAAILRRTRGHPLFVVETLRGLAAGETGPPETLQAAVLARLRRVGRDAEEVLRAGAVLGASVDPTVVAGMLELPAHAVARCCVEAIGAGLLVVAERYYEFANDLVQEIPAVPPARPPVSPS